MRERHALDGKGAQNAGALTSAQSASMNPRALSSSAAASPASTAAEVSASGAGAGAGHAGEQSADQGADAAPTVRKRLSVQRTGSLLMKAKPDATHVSDLQQDDGGLCSANVVGGQVVAGDQIYFLGIVDFLQTYTARKFLETNFKALRYKRNELSAVPPSTYARRFHDFMSKIIE